MAPAPEWDVAVVGAGPAGCAAALRLARGGARVVVLEKATPPRYKPCGGGLVGKALALLPDGAGDAIERRCHTATLALAGGPTFETRREAPVICTVMRADLDARLADLAAGAGAVLRTGAPVTGLEPVEGGVRVSTPEDTVTARYVIGADGANGPTARLAGWHEPPRLIPAVEHEVRVSPDTLAAWSDTCRFDYGVVPAGYAWVFPKGDHLSAGVLTTRPGRIDLNGAVGPYLEGLGIRALAVERHGHRIPFRPRPGPPVRGRVLLAGDAAGLADPLTLEGISSALQSGNLAAEALIETGMDHHGPALYQGRLAETVLAELHAATWFARLLYEHPRAAGWGFGWLGREGCDGVAAVMAGEITYRQLLARVPGLVLRRLLPFGRRSAAG